MSSIHNQIDPATENLADMKYHKLAIRRYAAIKGGNFTELRRLFREANSMYIPVYDENYVDAAINRLDKLGLAMLIWMHSIGVNVKYGKDSSDKDASSWLLENAGKLPVPKLDKSMVTYAIKKGDHFLLRRLQSQNCPWPLDCIDTAILYYKPKVLKWLTGGRRIYNIRFGLRLEHVDTACDTYDEIAADADCEIHEEQNCFAVEGQKCELNDAYNILEWINNNTQVLLEDCGFGSGCLIINMLEKARAFKAYQQIAAPQQSLANLESVLLDQ